MSKETRKPIGDLPSGVGVNKVFFKGEPYWRVRLGKRFTGGEVRVKHFTDLAAVREFIFGKEQKSNATDSKFGLIQPGVIRVKDKLGSVAFELTSAQLGEAQNAFQRLPKGVSLTQVIDDWLERRAPAGGVKTTTEVSAEFIVSRRGMGVRPRTLVQYESYLRSINEEFGDLPIADIERASIEDWLSESDWAPRSRKNYLVTLTTLLNFAQDREYCPGNPASRIERPILDDKAPGILTVKEATSLLETALNGIPDKFDPKPQMIPGIAIGLFAGLRRSELCALDWAEIDLTERYIEVKAAKAKTRQRRLVTISDNLAAWLKPYSKTEGLVTSSANEDVFGERLKAIAEASGIKEWPHNALRHSFGSYFFAKSKDENRTAAEMGNTPGVVFKHYRALVRNGDENKYWIIKP
jgi:integrase